MVNLREQVDVVKRTADERFWAKVDKHGPGGCWLWTGHINPNGYGLFRTGGTGSPRVNSHRYAYERVIGPIPAGLHLDHLCRVRACCNPAHLEPVTCRENVLRSDSIQAVNARKTCCPQGHAYDYTNTRVDRLGRRNCRACNRARQARRATERRLTEGR